MNNPDTGKPIDFVEVLPSCTCALRPWPHVHSTETYAWLKRIWIHDLAGKGDDSTINTFPGLR